MNTELIAPDYVVLGMVRTGARSGYEIKQTVERSIRFFWTISQAQIYPSLERLEWGGLLSGRDEPKGGRPRRVYDVTSTGQAALATWLRREDPMPLELRDLGLLKIFFADVLEPNDAASLLAAVKLRSKQAAAALRVLEPAATLLSETGTTHPLLTLHLGIALHQAMIDVCDEFASTHIPVAAPDDRASSSPPPPPPGSSSKPVNSDPDLTLTPPA